MDILNQIARVLKEEDDFLITSHVRPDGDCIGSQLALGLILERLGKRFQIINSDPPRKRFDFLPLFNRIKTSWNPEEIFRVAMILDCGKWSRIGDIASIARKANMIINIDHHRDSEGIGSLNYLNPDVSSTGEIIFSLFSLLGIDMTREIATNIYVAILTDTGRFRYSNTKAETHRAVAELLERGIFPEDIVGNIMSQETPDSLNFYCEIFSTLKTSSSDKICWYCVTRQMQDNYGSLDIESDKLFDELRTLKGFEVFLLFTEMPDGKIRASFRANLGIDVSPVARFFGGGGHPQACSCMIEGELESVQKDIIERVEMLLKL